MISGINSLFSFLAVILSFMPVFFLFKRKLAGDKTYLLIALYWMLNGLAVIPMYFEWSWYTGSRDQIIYLLNLVDAPFMFLIFYFSYRNKLFLLGLTAFMILDSLIIHLKGLSYDANAIITSVGGIFALLMNVGGLLRYARLTDHTSKDHVLVYVQTGFIFYYGLFFEVTYTYKYLTRNMGPVPFALFSPYGMFICYLAIVLSTLLISYGFWKVDRSNDWPIVSR